MWTIRDMVVGEIITVKNRQVAIKKAHERVKYHNQEFCYTHRGKHYSANATFTVNEQKQEILIK